MLKKALLYSLTALLTAAVVVAAVWLDQARPDKICRGVVVRIMNADEVNFVTEEGILRQVKSMPMRVAGSPLRKINTDAIERSLAKSEFLEGVECFFDLHGLLVVEATQLVPVMRVFDRDGGSYYVNRTGKRMPADGAYHVDVPIVRGDFNGSFQPTSLLPMMEYVAADEALSALVTMYDVADSCNVRFVPSIAGHIVNMGTADGFKSKFDKLMLFYREVMPEKGWNTYSEITLKWDHQVVGTRRDKRSAYEEEYDPDEDEQATDLGSAQVMPPPPSGQKHDTN